jgi:hypothetical protein
MARDSVGLAARQVCQAGGQTEAGVDGDRFDADSRRQWLAGQAIRVLGRRQADHVDAVSQAGQPERDLLHRAGAAVHWWERGFRAHLQHPHAQARGWRSAGARHGLSELVGTG